MFRQRAHGDADGRTIAAQDEFASQHDRWIAMLETQAAPVYRWIYLHVGNRQQAEELTTRVFDEAARGQPADAPTSEDARERLFQIARTVVADELRAFYGASAETILARMRRGTVEEVERMTTDETNQANLPAARVHDMLSRLPAREREVLTCRFLLGYPIERTAAQLHLSVPETMALQFVALRHASQLDAVAPTAVREHAQVPKMLQGCGCD